MSAKSIALAALIGLSASALHADEGQTAYERHCTLCHASGMMGAPRIGDREAWGWRRTQGMDTLFDHAINGFKGMPPMSKVDKMSDEAIKAATQYMVDKSS